MTCSLIFHVTIMIQLHHVSKNFPFPLQLEVRATSLGITAVFSLRVVNIRVNESRLVVCDTDYITTAAACSAIIFALRAFRFPFIVQNAQQTINTALELPTIPSQLESEMCLFFSFFVL